MEMTRELAAHCSFCLSPAPDKLMPFVLLSRLFPYFPA